MLSHAAGYHSPGLVGPWSEGSERFRSAIVTNGRRSKYIEVHLRLKTSLDSLTTEVAKISSCLQLEIALLYMTPKVLGIEAFGV